METSCLVHGPDAQPQNPGSTFKISSMMSSARLRDGRGALELVPGKGLAVHGALQGLEQHGGKELPVRETLQPEVQQKLHVFALAGLAAFQQEGQRGSNEIYDQKDHKVEHQ